MELYDLHQQYLLPSFRILSDETKFNLTKDNYSILFSRSEFISRASTLKKIGRK